MSSRLNGTLVKTDHFYINLCANCTKSKYILHFLTESG